MTLDAGDRKSIRRAEKASAIAERSRRDVTRMLMSSTEGRSYVWNKLTAAHIFSTSFSLEPLQMAFSEGERNAGLQLLNDIMDSCPDQFIEMMREQNVRSSANEQQPRGANPDGRTQVVGGSDSDDLGLYGDPDDGDEVGLPGSIDDPSGYFR